MASLKQFIADNRVRMSVEWADSNPNMDDGDWAASHYRCTLKVGRRQMTTYFSMGAAHTNEPTADDVLDCLASDASSAENARSFEEWADDLGYDTDSRKAERTYNVIQRQAAALRNLLGDDAYKALLWDTERL